MSETEKQIDASTIDRLRTTPESMTVTDFLALLSAAEVVQKVRELHVPEKRYHDGSAEWSVDTAREVADEHDIPVGEVEYFEVCAECGAAEAEFYHETGGHDWSYREGLWPCRTVKVLDAVS